MANGFSAARVAFTDNFAALGAAIYDYVPPAVAGNAIFVFPDEPYVTFPGLSIQNIRLRLKLTAVVPFNDNQGALINLEELIKGILAAMPSGVIINDFGAPNVTQVGNANLLVAETTVELPTTLGD